MAPTFGSLLTDKLSAYQRLQAAAGEDESFILHDDRNHSRPRRRKQVSRSMFLTSVGFNVLFVLGILFLFAKYQFLPREIPQHNTIPSYEAGFTTDFEDAKRALRVGPGPAHGGLSYNTTSKMMVRHHEPGTPQYFGKPSPAIDAAWHELVQGEFFALTDEEAQPYVDNPLPTGGKMFRMPQTGSYHMELGVFHSLHCVNALRKALEPDYYRDEHDDAGMPANWKREHMDHCLENLMHMVRCTSDITPVPLYAWQGFRIALGVTDARTCRNFDSVRDWLHERNSNGKGIDGI